MRDAATRQRREEIVRRHMESENTHEYAVTLGTFSHPRYELVATGQVYAATLQRQILAGAGPLAWLRALLALGRRRGLPRAPELAP